MLAEGYPAYTTSAGWLGFSDQQLRELCREAIANMNPSPASTPGGSRSPPARTR
jgi:hypothetical protein